MQYLSILLDNLLILILALALDLAVGEPKEGSFTEKLHPVVWMGKLIQFVDRNVKRKNPKKEYLAGVGCTFLIIVSFAIPCMLLLMIRPYSELLFVILSAVILKTTFSISALERFAKATLETDELGAKRKNVAKLVGRDTSQLDNGHLNSATIESVAENLTDSVVSPIVFYALFGLIGAMVYRAINTLDAMIGYKNRKYLHFGRFAAKLDTAVNYLPERMSASLICICCGERRHGFRTLRRYKVDKNIPKTIVAMSAALKIKLIKKAHYEVNGGLSLPSDEEVLRSIRIMRNASMVFTVMALMVILLVNLPLPMGMSNPLWYVWGGS